MSDLTQDHEAQQAQSNEPMIGEWLRRAREARGLTVAEVAQALKLTGRQVEAMETNRFELLPGPAFVRGFLRNYARHVGVDTDALLAEYEQFVRPAPVELAPVSNAGGVMPAGASRKAHVPVAGIAAALIFVVLAGWYFDWFQMPGTAVEVQVETSAAREGETPVALLPPQPEILDNAPASASAEDSAPTVATSGDAVNVPPAPASAAAAGVAQVAAPTPAPAAAPAPEAAVPVSEAESAAPEGVAHLRFRFAGESWVEVRDGSGKIVYSGTNREGSSRTVQGSPPFALVIGNARDVSLEYKGQAVDLAEHIRVTVARFSLQ